MRVRLRLIAALLFACVAPALAQAPSTTGHVTPLATWFFDVGLGLDLATVDGPRKSFDDVFFGVPQRSWQNDAALRLAVGTRLSRRASMHVEFDRTHAIDEREDLGVNPVSYRHRLRSEFAVQHYSALLAFRPSTSHLSIAYLAGFGAEHSRIRGAAYDRAGSAVALQQRRGATDVVMTLGVDAMVPVGRRFEIGGGLRTHLRWRGDFARLQPFAALRWRTSL